MNERPGNVPKKKILHDEEVIIEDLTAQEAAISGTENSVDTAVEKTADVESESDVESNVESDVESDVEDDTTAEAVTSDETEAEDVPEDAVLTADDDKTEVETATREKEISKMAREVTEDSSIRAGNTPTEVAEPPEDRVSDDSVPMDEESTPNAVIRRVRSEPKDVIPPAPKDKGFLYSFLDTLRFISLGLIIGILLVVFVVQRNDVYGSSMEPNLHQNDAVFVEMISKYFSDYERGSIVTIDATGMEPYSGKEKIIKRVIGKPGDTVTIKDGSVYVNGNLIVEPYLAEGVPTNMSADGTAKGYDNVTLGDGEYYCMGDNRGASMDSRVLGPIPESRIKAHVFAKIFPFDEMCIF